jgi:hypothetical protein
LLCCRTEPVIFKNKFKGWDDVIPVDFTRTSESVQRRGVDIKVSASTIYLRIKNAIYCRLLIVITLYFILWFASYEIVGEILLASWKYLVIAYPVMIVLVVHIYASHC